MGVKKKKIHGPMGFPPFSVTGSLPVHQELTTGRDKMGIGGDPKADLHLEETEATQQRELGMT